MKYLIAACMIFFHINCNVSSRPPYERFNGIEFLPCGDFYNGRIYIKDIHKFNINEMKKLWSVFLLRFKYFF